MGSRKKLWILLKFLRSSCNGSSRFLLTHQFQGVLCVNLKVPLELFFCVALKDSSIFSVTPKGTVLFFFILKGLCVFFGHNSRFFVVLCSE